MAAIYDQIIINDPVIARYTADAWRSRIYAVRYFLVIASRGRSNRWASRSRLPRRHAAIQPIAVAAIRAGLSRSAEAG